MTEYSRVLVLRPGRFVIKIRVGAVVVLYISIVNVILRHREHRCRDESLLEVRVDKYARDTSSSVSSIGNYIEKMKKKPYVKIPS